MPLPHWSREYFRLESNAKRGGCKFCGKTYANSVTRFKEHLKVRIFWFCLIFFRVVLKLINLQDHIF